MTLLYRPAFVAGLLPGRHVCWLREYTSCASAN